MGAGKKTKREEFLEIMDEINPWEEWAGLIRPYYPTGKQRRPPIWLKLMLRMYLLQVWFNLSDPGTEDAIYDSYAIVHDVTVAHGLIREDDEVVYGDSAYLGLEMRMEVVNDEHLSSIECRVNLRPGSFPKVSDNAIDWTRWIGKRKSSVRCKVEHIFRIIKCQFGYRKTRYRSLKKNGNRLYAMFACANLYLLAMAGRRLREA